MKIFVSKIDGSNQRLKINKNYLDDVDKHIHVIQSCSGKLLGTSGVS